MRLIPISAVLAVGLSGLTAMPAQALTLQRGVETHLAGDLGDLQVNYVADSGSLTGYLDSTGLVNVADPADYIAHERVQYDLLNNSGNLVFEFTVEFEPGTTVIGAADPTGYWDAAGNLNDWGGEPFVTLFDAGFGVYDYNTTQFGSEWHIEYLSDHVTWSHRGNGMPTGAASGDTEFGFEPTFALFFAPDTPLGLQPAEALGITATGQPEVSSGQVLSAVAVTVPAPGTLTLVAAGLLGLATAARRRKC